MCACLQNATAYVLHDKRYKCIPVCSAYMHMKQLVFTCKEISGNLYGITIASVEMQSFLPVAFLLSEASGETSQSPSTGCSQNAAASKERHGFCYVNMQQLAAEYGGISQ